MPPAATTDGSQQTVTSGTAVQIAAETVKLRLLRLFAREHNLDINLLDTKDDFVVDRDGSRLASIEEAGNPRICFGCRGVRQRHAAQRGPDRSAAWPMARAATDTRKDGPWVKPPKA